MQKHVVYYYYTVGKQSSSIMTDSFFVLDSFPIAGLTDPRNSKTIDITLRPFEVQQDNLYSLISRADDLGIKILKVEFDDIDFELEEELIEALRTNSPTHISSVIKIVQSQNFEINAVSFYYNSRQYRITKHAVAEIIGNWEEIPGLSVDTPLAMVTGMKKFPNERSFGY